MQTPMRFFMTCDGEAKQIEVFQQPEIIQLFEENHIDLAKTPASCSGICQPSDVSPFFLASKKRLRSPSPKKFLLTDDENHMAVTDLRTALEGTQFSNEKKTIVMKSVIKVAQAIRETLVLNVVKSGYVKSGIWPINFDVAMNQCRGDLSLAERDQARRSVEHLTGLFREKGVVTEKDMDDQQIKSIDLDSRKTPKDQRVLHQQRAVLMNSEACIRKYREYHDLLAAKAATTAAGGPRAAKGPNLDLQLYDSWFETLTPELKKAEKALQVTAGGKIKRRKVKVVELRAAGWTAVAPVDEEPTELD